jgi:hypothetical protein
MPSVLVLIRRSQRRPGMAEPFFPCGPGASDEARSISRSPVAGDQLSHRVLMAAADLLRDDLGLARAEE